MLERLEQRRLEFLAGQFARPSGKAGRWLIGPWLNRVSRAMNRLTLEQLDLSPQDRVLEVGFGGGELIELMLAMSPQEVVGVDISQVMVARARRRLRKPERQGTLRLIEASVDRLPLPDAALDKACSVNNIYFWPDPAAGMAELARVLRPGGRLVIAFEPPEELRKWPGHRFGFRLFGEGEVVELAAAAGFGDISVASGTGRSPDRFLCLSGIRADG